MAILKYFLLICISVLVAACGTPRHNILGANYGWDTEKVTVISDIEINSLRIRQVRMKHDQCKSGFINHLELSGPIGPDASEVVDRILAGVPICEDKLNGRRFSSAVFLNSNGGLLKDGYRLGQTFRKFSVQTVVANKQFCASSCAIAFIGGKYRGIYGDGRLSFHSPYWKSGASISCPSREEAKDLNDYYASFLESKDSQFLFERTMAFCSKSEGWMINSDAAKLFGITTS